MWNRCQFTFLLRLLIVLWALSLSYTRREVMFVCCFLWKKIIYKYFIVLWFAHCFLYFWFFTRQIFLSCETSFEAWFVCILNTNRKSYAPIWILIFFLLYVWKCSNLHTSSWSNPLVSFLANNLLIYHSKRNTSCVKFIKFSFGEIFLSVNVFDCFLDIDGLCHNQTRCFELLHL